MDTDGQGRRTAAAGELLRELLGTRARYIRAWRVHGDRQRGEINQRAVAKVIALYLWDAGLRSDTEVDLPTQLKNIVNRALLGRRLTASTLEHFIRAFDMSEDDQRELWRVFAGDEGVAHTIVTPRGMARRQWHRTNSLFERYYLDVNRVVVSRRTVQGIEAKESGVDSYLFNHEPWVTQIDVVHGGRIGRHYEYGNGLVADDIVLDRPLLAGERTALEYVTQYEREYELSEVRRPARGRTSNVTLGLHFAPTAVPGQVWFSVWTDHILGAPVEEQPIDLMPNASALVCLPYIEQTVVGFRWQW